MEINNYQKATAILKSLERQEENLRNLKLIHESKNPIKVMSDAGVLCVQVSGLGDTMHIIEYLIMRTNKNIETLKESFAKL